MDPTLATSDPMFAPRRGSLKDQISVHHLESAQSARTTQQIYNRTLPSLHFLRWRPMFHLLAPNAWMNDPCGPCYDPTTGLYHISFEWNPRRNKHGNVAWGHVAWGSATSKDLLSWSVHSLPTLKPDQSYDEAGIFTGTIYPTAVDGTPGTLTAVYTSVSGSPVHYTLPYTRGCETQSIAQSKDGGKSWVKCKKNPILREPPAHLQPCGWRDPYLASWSSMDKALGFSNNSHLYGMISGGIAGVSPTLFLYAVPRNQLDRWEFISPIVNLGPNHRLSRWSGDMGRNFEAGTFMALSDSQGTTRDFIVVGAEGCKSSGNEGKHSRTRPQRSTEVSREARSQQWMSGDLLVSQAADSDQKTVEMKYKFGGRFDHGCLYGVNTFWDPVKSQQIAWGWIREEDLPQHLVDRQNWSGLMSLPRELRLLTLHNVTSALSSPLESITSVEVTPSKSQGAHTLRTLGIYPASTLKRLRISSRECSLPVSTPLPILDSPPHAQTTSTLSHTLLDIQTCRFELSTSITIPRHYHTDPSSSDNCINISISHCPNHTLLTTLSFHPATETLILRRANSSSVDPGIKTSPEIAPHTLFTSCNPDTGKEQLETLDVRMWFDESVLEIFVNGRTVISSRIYPGRKRCWGVLFWVGRKGLEDAAVDEDVIMEDDSPEEEEKRDVEDVRGHKKKDRDVDAAAAVGEVTIKEARGWDGLRADSRIV